jgi:SAM-dependent methyltransferase
MSKEFVFPEIDEIGIDTLDSISFAPNFNEWMYDTIKHYCAGNILEIGSGIGNISKYFIRDHAQIHLTDIRDNYISILLDNFGNSAASVFKIDLVDEAFDQKHEKQFEQYDSIFALNVIEHIKEDQIALHNAYKLLKPGGRLIILVPAYNCLYNSFDKALEHYRRYTKTSLQRIFPKSMEFIHTQYFNAFGMLGWFVNGQLLKKKTIPRNQMELYDKLILLSKSIDKIVFNKIGLSTIAVAKK